MPISSSNRRLTRESYRPPPKSLDELRILEHNKFHSSGSIGLGERTRMGLSRERHLDGFSARKTAVVAPVNDSSDMTKVGNGKTTSHDTAKIATVTNAQHQVVATKSAAASVFGICCFRFNILAFLLGLLLGASIVGLAVGLVLYEEIKERDAIIADLQEKNQGCFKDPCPSRSSSCGYSANNTEIRCLCKDQTGDQPYTAAGYIDGYICSFFNVTANTTATTFSPAT